MRTRETDRAWYAAHRAEINARRRAARAADPDAAHAADRARRQRPGYRVRVREYERGSLAKARSDRRYAAGHRAEVAARKAAWYQANRDRILAEQRARYAADPGRALARVRAWEQEQPVRAAANHAAKSANRRAAMYGAQGQISGETVLELWRREPDCVDCGDGQGLDHVIALSRGGSNSSGNLANRCRSCNSRKGAREQAVAA